MFRNSWDEVLQDELEKEYFKKMCEFLHEEYEKHTVYPRKTQVFRALYNTPYEDVDVLILGQDPYHQPGQACGFAFSVPADMTIPPSLRNIYKELSQDKKIPVPRNGDLSAWAKRGVLMLNASLTVRAGEANSHSNIGWHEFTDAIISALSARERPLVFILWGNFARAKKSLIDGDRHLILEGTHPSPLSAHTGFFGGRYFSKAEKFLGKEIFF